MAQKSVDQLLELLAKGKPVPGIFLYGEDVYLREVCRKKLVKVYVEPSTREWAVARFSAKGDSADLVLGQAQMLPMLAPRQVVFWSELDALEKLGDKSRDAIVDRLNEYLQNPAPFTILVLEAGHLDARTRLFKTLSEKTIVVGCELQGDMPERIAAVVPLATEMARDLGLQIDRDAAQALAESTNAGLAQVQMELEKLASYIGDRKRITRDDIEAVVISDQRFSIWQLSEMLAEGDRPRALEFLGSVLREGEQPPMIVGTLAWMFRKLIEVQDLPRGAGPGEAARLGMRMNTAILALKHAPRIPREQLTKGLLALSEADSLLKSGVKNPRAVLEFLLAELMDPHFKKRQTHQAAVGAKR